MREQGGYYYIVETEELTEEVKNHFDRYRWVSCDVFNSRTAAEKELARRIRTDFKGTSVEEREVLGIGVGINPTKVNDWIYMHVRNNRSPRVAGWRHRRLVSTRDCDRWDNTLHYLRVFDKKAYAPRVVRVGLTDYLEMRVAAPAEVGERILKVESPSETIVYFKEKFNGRCGGLPNVLQQAIRKKEPNIHPVGESPNTFEVWPIPKNGEAISFDPTPANVEIFKATAPSLLSSAFFYVSHGVEPRITFSVRGQINPGVFDIFCLLWRMPTTTNEIKESAHEAKKALITEVEAYIRAHAHLPYA